MIYQMADLYVLKMICQCAVKMKPIIQENVEEKSGLNQVNIFFIHREEEESEGENEGDDALSEEGKSWDSMEEEAKKSDMEKVKKLKENENFKKNNKNKRKK